MSENMRIHAVAEGGSVGRSCAALEAENARLRAELAKARAVVEPLERLLANVGGVTIKIRKFATDLFDVSNGVTWTEGKTLAEALANAEKRT